MKLLPLIEFFRNLARLRYYRRRLVQLIIFILIFFIFCAGLFWFEYTGRDENFIDKYPALRIIKYFPKILNIYYLPLMFNRSDLPRYELIIDKNYLADLDKMMPKNICCNCLPDGASKYEKAKFIFEGKEYQVKIKVRGDCSNHWSFAKKSWRIKFADDDLFFGLNQFDLIIPDDREFIAELLNNYRAKKIGLVVPEMKLVTLKINGQYFGPYLFQEAIGSNLFKKEENGSNFQIFGDKLITDKLFLDTSNWQRYDDNNEVKGFEKLENLLKLINDSSDEQFYKEIVKIVDLENFYKWNILSLLAGNYHQDFAHNMRIYFDTNIGKFKFIPADVGLSNSPPIDLIYNPLVTRIIKNLKFLHERNIVFWSYVKDENNLVDDMEFFDQAYDQLRWPLYRDWKSTYSNFYFDRKVSVRRRRFSDLFKEARNTLNSGNVQINLFFADKSKEIVLSQIKFFVDNFSGANLKKIEIGLKAGSRLNDNLYLYFDSDRNKAFDFEDEKISNFKIVGDKITTEEFSKILLADREFPEAINYSSQDSMAGVGPLMKPIPIVKTRHDFFIIAEKRDSLTAADIFGRFSFDLANAITGQPLKNEIILSAK